MTTDSVVQTQSLPESPSFSRLWWLYFMLCIVGLSPLTAYIFSVPFYLLSKIYPPAQKLADRNLRRGVQLLFACQPWMKLKAEIGDIPAGALLVSNHRSHLDVFILLSQIPGIRVVAKQSLFRIPFLAFMMRHSRQIPVQAGRLDSVAKAMEIARERLKQKETVHIFPEFTRCPAGNKGLLKFVLAPFHIAFQENIPIIPLVFKNTDGAWPKGQMAISYQAPMELIRLPTIYPKNFESVQKLCAETQTKILEALT